MGVVDIADQLTTVYISHIRSRNTWRPLLFWILDTCANNSYLILSKLDPKWHNEHKQFSVVLSWDFVGAFLPFGNKCRERSNPKMTTTRQKEGGKRLSMDALNSSGFGFAAAKAYVTAKNAA